MRLFKRTFAICAATALLAPAAFALDSDVSSAEKETGLQRTADIVNLMRSVFDPNPAPVLVSPAERAVAGKTSAGSGAAVVKTVPVVIMPDIARPEEESGKPDKAGARIEEPAQPAVVVSSSKRQIETGTGLACIVMRMNLLNGLRHHLANILILNIKTDLSVRL